MFEFSETMRAVIATTGDDIREARERLGLSQAELAKVAGVALDSVEKIESGYIIGDYAKQRVMIFLGLIRDSQDSGTRH